MDEFADRIRASGDKQIFHGGDTPDLVDFKAYSIIQRMSHTFVVIQILNDREDPLILNWFNGMKRLCKP